MTSPNSAFVASCHHARVVLVCLLLIVGSLAQPQPGHASNNDVVAGALKSIITSGTIKLDDQIGSDRLLQIFAFYHDRAFKPIWTRDSGAKTKGRELLRLLLAAGEHGLNPESYGVEDLVERIDTKDPGVLAELDLLMSNAFAEYARDLTKGRIDPSSAGDDLALYPHGPGPLYLIDGAEAAEDLAPYVATLWPKTPRYARVLKALKNYQNISGNGGWGTVAVAETLLPGSDDPVIPQIRKRLQITGDLPAGADVTKAEYDEELNKAVKRFQVRHGQIPHGLIDDETVRFMNVPVGQRIRQLIVNLERRRWMRNEYGDPHVLINQADQELKLVRGGKTVHTARLSVGTPDNRTPVFTAELRSIIINPGWKIPDKLARESYVPLLRIGPGVLARQNISIMLNGSKLSYEDIDWKNMKEFEHELVMGPGVRNPLGFFKFGHTGPQNVEISGTPDQDQFFESRRYLSRFGVAIEAPGTLAVLLLEDQNWTEDKLKDIVASGKGKTINLPKPIALHVTYLTAWVNKDGTVHFREDIYGRDTRLETALAK